MFVNPELWAVTLGNCKLGGVSLGYPAGRSASESGTCRGISGAAIESTVWRAVEVGYTSAPRHSGLSLQWDHLLETSDFIFGLLIS